MYNLFGINPFSSTLFWILLVSIAGALAAWARRPWIGGAVAALVSVLLLHPRSMIRAPLIPLSLTLVGFTAGVTGVALRQRRSRLAALGSIWTGAGLDLFYLYWLSERPHDTADLVFAGGMLVTILVSGSLTVVVLPPDDQPPRQIPPPA